MPKDLNNIIMKNLITLITQPKKSGDIIAYSIQLAELLGSKLHLLYVEDPDPYPLGMTNASGRAFQDLRDGFEKRKEILVEQFLDQAAENSHLAGGRVIVDVSVDQGKATDILNRMISDFQEASMVLVDYQEEEYIWYKNEKTRSVVMSVNCPVWVLPSSRSFTPFLSIVYATDYQKEDIPFLKKLIGALEPFLPQITALHVTDDVDFDMKLKQAGFQKMIQEEMGNDRVRVETLAEDEGEDLAKAINDYCRKSGTDLLVLLKENDGFLKRIFTESLTEKTLKQAQLPLLVFHQERAR